MVFRCVIILGLSVYTLVFVHLYGAEISGMDVFIKACQNQGLNGALIRSGYAEMELHEFRRINIAAEKERIERSIEATKKLFKDDPETLNNLVKSDEERRDNLKEEETYRFRYAILFKGNDPGSGLRRVVLDRLFDSRNELYSGRSDTLISRGDIKGNNLTALMDAANGGEVRIGLGNFYVEPFQKFGRVQGTLSKMATVSMLDPNVLDQFVFLAHKIENLKKTMRQLAGSSGATILQISGNTSYDDGAGNAVILESQNAKGIVYMRYWIDPSRGYVCPLVQEYSPENGKILKEYTSGDYFLHAKSGLWYPATHEEKTWDENETLTESQLYTIDPDTFQFNQPVSDQEFYIDVPEGQTVVDSRGMPSMTPLPTYHSIDKGTLSLAKNGLNLSEMTWLSPLEIPREYQIQRGRYILFRLSLVGIGLIFISIALYRMWRRGKKTPPSVMLLLPLLLLAEMGCTKDPASASMDSPVFASPSVLDFGKVRPTDPPVEVSFDLCNHGNEDVSVTDVLSGCGCTVVDIPKESISSGGKAAITARVNVHGRSGIFENMLLVKTTMGTSKEQNLFVQIHGHVEADIWANEQSIRCTLAPKAQQVSTVLLLHTVKYPNVTFSADIPQEEGITVDEISREIKDGETVIKFLVTLDAGENKDEMITKTLSIVPKEDSIAGLTIPLYCYREGGDQLGAALTTSQINLGLIQSSEAADCRIYGDPDILVAVKEIDLRNVSDAIQHNVKTSFRFDTVDKANDSDSFLTVTLLPDSIAAGSLIDGKLILKTHGNREYAVDLRAEIR